MPFKNLTPFDAMEFTGIDTKDREYDVFAMAVGYALRPSTTSGALPDDFVTVVRDQAPVALCLGDDHYGEEGESSLRRESDLIPYKPRCDVLVIGSAHAPFNSARFAASLAVRENGKALIDKELVFHGERHFERRPGMGGWLGQALSPPLVYDLTPAAPTRAVPLRYELAFGGTVRVADPHSEADPMAWLVNEACYRNPIGCGWLPEHYNAELGKARLPLPPQLPAPRIERRDDRIRFLGVSAQRGAMQAPEMAALHYPHQPAGFGPLGKAWAPRLKKAGTYDQAWLDMRHPYLPADFDFSYWNGAPEDQQIDFPRPGHLHFELHNLHRGGGAMRFVLPADRAFVLMRLDNGLVLANPMHIDTLIVDNSQEEPCLIAVWRTAVLKEVGLRAAEARFERDPHAPLLKLGRPSGTGGTHG